MGLFSSNYNKIEKQLLEHYVQYFKEMELPDAKKTAKDMLDKAIESSKKQGTYDLPPNMGDIILGKANPKDIKSEKMAGYIQKYLPAKRKDGVKDEDIIWCWNLYDVERSIILAVDEFHRMALFISVLKETGSEKEAGNQVWKHHPSYTAGDPKNEKLFIEGHTGEDLPLPIELKDRVNRYIKKRAEGDPEEIKQELKKFSTFNAFIRKEIKAGNI